MNKIIEPNNINEALFHCIHQSDAMDLIEHALLSNRKLISKVRESKIYGKDEYSFIISKSDDNNNMNSEVYIKDYMMERKDYKNWTAVFECAKYGKYEAFTYFIEYGFSCVNVDTDWKTPYDIAIQYKNYECAEKILKNHMFPYNEWNEILFHACENAYPDSNNILRKALYENQIITFDQVDKKIKFSKKCKFKMYTPNWQNTKENNQTALHVAAKNVDYFKISILIEYGFTTDGVLNDKGKTPFDIFRDVGDIDWLTLYEARCRDARKAKCSSVEKYMHEKLLEAKTNFTIDELTVVLDEAIKSKLSIFSIKYKETLADVLNFRNENYKTQIKMANDLIKGKKNAVKSRRYDLFEELLLSYNEYIQIHDKSIGNKLRATIKDAQDQLTKWKDSVNTMISKLNIEFKTKDIMRLENVLSEARQIVVISNDFYGFLADKIEVKNKWETELRQELLNAGCPEEFISRYIRRICPNIEQLHNIRWSEIKQIGIENKEICRVIQRNLQLRNGQDNLDDLSANEMLQFLKDCNLIQHLQILSYSGFIDVEDLAEENDLAIFDDIMSTAEISRLERQLELFRKKNLRNLIGQTITTKK